MIKRCFVFLGLFFLVGSLHAFDWSVHKFKVEKMEKRGKKSVVFLSTPKKQLLEVVYKGGVNPEAVRKLLKLTKMVADWPRLVVKSIRCNFIKDTVQFVVIPSTFVYEKQDLAKYMPAGIVFFYDNYLYYDFRMVKNNVSMKLKGSYINRAEFLLNLMYAVRNPLSYADKSNYMARMDRLEQELSRLKRAHYSLKIQFDKLRYTVMTLHNTGFLRGPRTISLQKIAKVLALKAKYEAQYQSKGKKLSWDELEDLIEKAGVDISGTEFELIMRVYFPRYKK